MESHHARIPLKPSAPIQFLTAPLLEQKALGVSDLLQEVLVGAKAARASPSILGHEAHVLDLD